MIENTVFILILIGVLAAIVYGKVPVKYRSLYLVIVSLTVYYVWAGIYPLIVLLVEILIGWIAYKGITRNNYSNIWMISGIILIVMVLAFFKYKDAVFSSDDTVKNLIIPLGLSYYSFKIISFLVDAYKKRIDKKNRYIKVADYLTYVSFFPQIICGPISRYDEICDFLDKTPEEEDIKDGIYHIIRGLFYKIVIADRISVYTLRVFGNYQIHNSLALWMAAFLFSIELYADFAGYSYIVVGLCRFYGIRIAENFNLPYFSANVREFWTRWHISLSLWLKDYVYIPLGGNRKGEFRKKINILAVFLVSGLWHGNTLPYLFWGIWHGLWNILSPKKYKTNAGKSISTICTFLIVMFGWVTFKLSKVSDIVKYIKGMFTWNRISLGYIVDAVMPFSNDYSCLAKLITVIILILILFFMELCEYKGKRIGDRIQVYIFIVAIVLFGVMGQNNFIYANY